MATAQIFDGNIDVNEDELLDALDILLSDDENGPDSSGSIAKVDSSDKLSTVDGSNKKRKRSPNPDAEIIAMVTEENLRSMNLDPNSKEGKQQKRKIRNRMTAQFHRERKKAYIDQLEEMIKNRDSLIGKLNSEILTLRAENDTLRQKLHIGVQAHKPLITPDQLSNISPITSDAEDSDTTTDNSNRTRSSSTLSLFSIFLMVSFMFFGASDITVPQSSTSAATSGSSLAVFNPNGILGEGYWSNSLYDMTHVSSQDAPPAFVTSTNSLNSNNNHRQVVISPDQALWKYQDRALQLYPRLHSYQYMQRLDIKNPLQKRHLRHSRTSSSSSSSSALVPSYIFPSDKTSSTNPPNTASSTSSASSTASSTVMSTSKVLMTQGNALLDPSLPLGPHRSSMSRPVVYTTSESDESSADHAPSTNTATSLIPAVNTNNPTAWSSVSSIPSVSSESIHNTKDVISSVGLTSTGSRSTYWGPFHGSLEASATPETVSTENVLVMLLPASSIRWGKSWAQSADFDMQWMLNKAQADNKENSEQNESVEYNQGFQGAQSPEGGVPDASNMWVEIGCTIFKAQLVKNVTLMT